MALTTVNPAMIGQTSTGASSLTATGSAAASLITAAGTALSADSSGRVTMPNQPGFFIYGYTPSNVGGSNYFKATSPNTQWSVGSGLSLAGGTSGGTRYTAPVSGYYFFQWSLMGDANSAARLIAFTDRNGSILTEADSYSSQYNCANVQYILYLAANDYLEFRTSGPYYNTSNNAHYMSVRLLG